MPPFLFGVDVLLSQQSYFRTARLGLVTNNAATTNSGISSRLALLRAGFNIVRLFSPEHGLSVTGADGSYQADHRDELTGLPVISLYGDKLAPAPQDLEDLDIILFDIPDAGCRFYTYLWTMTYVMDACTASQKKLVILDRPNPLGGDLQKAEGPRLDEAHCSSFIGRWDIPVTHSCTLGELAGYFRATRRIDLDLEIVRVQNWKREEHVLQAGWLFVPTSPAIRNPETLFLYPGTGLLEGINVNEGRGTDHPFMLFGAPWINTSLLKTELSQLKLPGIKFEPVNYTPRWGFYENQLCHGIQLFVIDINTFFPVITGLQIIRLLKTIFNRDCTERKYPTIANPTGIRHLDRLTGLSASLEKILIGNYKNPEFSTGTWEEIIHPFLLY